MTTSLLTAYAIVLFALGAAADDLGFNEITLSPGAVTAETFEFDLRWSQFADLNGGMAEPLHFGSLSVSAQHDAYSIVATVWREGQDDGVWGWSSVGNYFMPGTRVFPTYGFTWHGIAGPISVTALADDPFAAHIVYAFPDAPPPPSNGVPDAGSSAALISLAAMAFIGFGKVRLFTAAILPQPGQHRLSP